MARDDPQDLLGAACAGDPVAVSALLAAHRAGLERFVSLRMDRALRRRVEPEDVVQEALAEAAQRLPRWCAERNHPFQLWLRMTTSQSLDEARRRHLGAQKRAAGRERSVTSKSARSDRGAVADWLAASQTTASEAARRDELRAGFLAAFEAMGELDREILTLRHLEGLSNEEAALELGIDRGTASQRFVRALARLRPLLLPFDPEESAGAQ